jgi:tetratricopeptide (TPR) repeat protein
MVKRARVNNELQLISRRLTGLCMKRPGLALGVWGEAGIGKTHTVLALLRSAPCQTQNVHANQAFEKIFLQIPRPKKLTLWLEKTLERIGKGETLETGMLNQALAALLAANAPIVLHVEDLHDASEERLEFWKQLAIVVRRTRGVGLMVTSRIQPPESFEAIKLAPLDHKESDVLLETEVGAKLPTEALAWLFERAAGNPLFTLEFFRLLARQGSLWNDGQRWRWRIPERETMPVTVEALIEQVLREAVNTPALENVIGAKAMLGFGALESLWAEVAGLTLEALSAIKQELEHQGVLSDGEFVHPLFREIIVHGLQPEQRQRFARQALKVLNDDPRVAAEFVKNARLEPCETLGWFERAAQSSSDVGDKVQSARFKAQAVEYASGEEKGRLAFEAAQELRDVQLHEALDLAEQASKSVIHRYEAIWLIAEMQALSGQIAEAESTLLRLGEIDPNGLPYLERLVQLRGIADDNQGIIELIRQHHKLLENPQLRTAAWVCWSLAKKGFLDEAEEVALKALNRSEVNFEARADVYVALSNICFMRNDHIGLMQFATKTLEIAQQIGNLRLQAEAYFNRAMSGGNLIGYAQRKHDLEESLRISILLGDNSGYMIIQSFYGDVFTENAEYSEAEVLLLEASTYLRETDLSDYLVTNEVRLSKLYMDWQPSHGKVLALKHAYAALEISRRRSYPLGLLLALYYAARAEAWAGQVALALALAKEAVEVAQTLPVPKMLEYVNLAQGYAAQAKGDFESSQTHFREAEHHASGIEAQKIGLWLDHSIGDVKRARERMEWFAERELMNGVNIALRYFPELAPSTTQPSSQEETTATFAYLEALGSMQIKLESQTTTIRGRKRQELFALLLEARISGRGEVSKLELVDKLYPDADEIQANAGLRDVIYQIRSSLSESTLTTTANGYALGSLKTDVETFLETGNTQLWRGIYLEGLLLETSDTVRESLYLALRTRAEALLEIDPTEVTRVGRLMSEADPYDLEALRLTVTGLRAGQNHRSLSRFYNQARARFLEIGEVLPARWQDFLIPIGATA